MSREAMRLLGILLLLLASLTGCDDEQDPTPESVPSSSSTTSTTSATSATPEAPVPDPGPLEFRPVLVAPGTTCAPRDPASVPASDPTAAWHAAITARACRALDQLDCEGAGDERTGRVTRHDTVAVCSHATADQPAEPFLLGKPLFTGGITAASSAISGVGHVVDVKVEGQAQDVIARVSGALAATDLQLALVLGDQVLSAPTFNAAITDGELQISGDFTEGEAAALAEALTLSIGN